MNVVACVTISVLPLFSKIAGVDHDGISSREVRQTSLPVSTSNAARNEFFWMSHCTITSLFQMIGELPTPHS